VLRTPAQAAETIASITGDATERRPEQTREKRMAAFVQRNPFVVGCASTHQLRLAAIALAGSY
jgi:hypothetical protein